MGRARSVLRMLTDTEVNALLRRPAVWVEPSATVGEAAKVMRDQRISSVLVRDEASSNGTFVGIPGGHPITSLLGAILVGAAAGYVGRSHGSESAMLVLGIFGAIAGYLGGDAIAIGEENAHGRLFQIHDAVAGEGELQALAGGVGVDGAAGFVGDGFDDGDDAALAVDEFRAEAFPGIGLTGFAKNKVVAESSSRAPIRRFPIIAIGASAGGLEAFTRLLKRLPADTGMAFVLVQHLDPDHASVLTQILAQASTMPVHEVTNNLRIAPNHVYVIPPSVTLGVVRGARPVGTAVTALVVLTDVVKRGVPASTAREAVAPFGADLYPTLKRTCDEYFFLKHRGEPLSEHLVKLALGIAAAVADEDAGCHGGAV